MTRSRTDRWRDDPWYVAGLVVIGSLMRIFLRIRFVGLEHVPRRGGAILAANHVSVLDPIAIALGPARLGRTVSFLGAAELFERRRHVVSWGLRTFHQIPVRRGMADRAALEEVAAVIRGGALAGIFPEGRMGDGPGLQRGHRGVARIALTAAVPIVPIGIWGTERRWPRRGFRWALPLRPTVTVVFGRSIQPLGEARDRRTVIALTDRVMSEIGQALTRAQAMSGVRS